MAEVAIESYYHNRMTAICTVIWTFFPSMLALFVPIVVLILMKKVKILSKLFKMCHVRFYYEMEG